MKTTLRILLGLSICFLCYLCVMSVMTPINFENTREAREEAVIKNLVDIRTAQVEYRAQHGRYTANLDSLIIFVCTGEKKEVVKEGALTDKQLEAGLTEHKAVKMIEKAQKTGKWKEVEENGLMGFKRDTISTPLLEALYHGRFDAESIKEILVIPYTDNVHYEALVNDSYTTSQGIHVPLLEVRAHFNTWLADQDEQELVNLVDREEKLGHFPGLRIGSVDEPNNNAGNWE